ncbi:MAG TPA: glycosyltransferase [Vicinamibacterales bacterium]
MSVPLLAAITRTGSADGVAVVADLLHGALVHGWGPDVRTVTMFDGPAAAPRLADKVRFTLRLGRALVRTRPAWVVANHLGLLRALSGMPGIVRPPYAVFLHGIEAWRPFGPSTLRLVSCARVRLANSHYTARRVQATNPGVGPIEVCHLALPASRAPREPDPGTAIPDIGEAAVLAVGRMAASERYKGHDALLAAWPQVIARVPSARLVFAGGGDDVERIRKAAANPVLRGTVHVAGFVPDAELELLYRRSAVFALPSTDEGFGLVYLEAMARGLPCVALRDSAAAEIVADGVTGVLAASREPDALAAALIPLLADRERRVAMGEAARARVTHEFSRARFEARVTEALSRAFAATHEPAA